jgi:SAM-dependent methyltransferase
MEYLSVHRLSPRVYSEVYFFDEYQKQYGKTYLDDFSHIQAMGGQRISLLQKALGDNFPKMVLDVGCAYGPFMVAVAAEGHRPFGLDIAPEAVEYVRSTLGFPAVQASFLDFSWKSSFPGEPVPDAVTLWYVIEHFPDLDAVLRKANRLLPLGGVLAFSTPNGRGISRQFRPQKFWHESPDDHFSIWNPSNTSRVLRRFGFEVAYQRITGQHPERFPGLKKSSGIRYSVVAWLDRWLGWGDTFEVYARKTKELL